MPTLLSEAVVAAEDERFYQHDGIDVVGVVRASWFDLTHWCLCQGGSTITEQLLKDVYLGGSDRGVTKLVDIVTALKVERVLNKQQILADYLSEIPMGPGLYGVTAASETYFHRPLESLDLGQYALLAGLSRAPSLYDPLSHPQAALKRRQEVLTAMVDEGYITREQAATAAQEPLLPSTMP